MGDISDMEDRSPHEPLSTGKGLRFNAGKSRVDLISPVFLKGLADVLTFGAKKYAPHNWRKGLSWTETVASAQRHLLAFLSGEDIDEESGLPHIDMLACNVMFLSAMQKLNFGTDDRYKEVPNASNPNRTA